uniref:Uncharacterized protein n=1 Tax=Romanomermis culicivorax TaxID=13658 RepID=A0A915IV60_ROMCU
MVGKSDDQNQRSRVERESAWLSKIKADLVNNTKEREAYLTEIKTKFIDEIKSALTELTAANNSRINGIAKLVATPTVSRRQKRETSEEKNNNGTLSEGAKDRDKGKGKGRGRGRGLFKFGRSKSDGEKGRNDSGGMQQRTLDNKNSETRGFSSQLRHRVLGNGTTPTSETSLAGNATV